MEAGSVVGAFINKKRIYCTVIFSRGSRILKVREHGQAAGRGLVDVVAYWAGWDGGPNLLH
jgi:hypothetical protein